MENDMLFKICFYFQFAVSSFNECEIIKKNLNTYMYETFIVFFSNLIGSYKSIICLALLAVEI